MKIIWYGYSCFEITGSDGTVIFDPYQEGSIPGLNKLHLHRVAYLGEKNEN